MLTQVVINYVHQSGYVTLKGKQCPSQSKVITTMKLMYFIAKKDLSIATYQELCDLVVILEVPNMVKQHDYRSYTSRNGVYKFLVAFGKYLLEIKSSNLINSPYYTLMLDESTNNG